MHAARGPAIALILLGLGCAHLPAARASPPLRATLGELETAEETCGPEGWEACVGLERGSRSAKLRAQALEGEGDEAELEFTYLGATEQLAPLASGELRRQLGIKLRSQDSCNVLYVMWRISPTSGIFISRKANPGAHSHAACGTAGYLTQRARLLRPLPTLAPGSRHRLRAKLEGLALRVWLDGELLWEGAVDEATLRFDGPIGLRSDNVRFAFTLGR